MEDGAIPKVCVTGAILGCKVLNIERPLTQKELDSIFINITPALFKSYPPIIVKSEGVVLDFASTPRVADILEVLSDLRNGRQVAFANDVIGRKYTDMAGGCDSEAAQFSRDSMHQVQRVDDDTEPLLLRHEMFDGSVDVRDTATILDKVELIRDHLGSGCVHTRKLNRLYALSVCRTSTEADITTAIRKLHDGDIGLGFMTRNNEYDVVQVRVG